MCYWLIYRFISKYQIIFKIFFFKIYIKIVNFNIHDIIYILKKTNKILNHILIVYEKQKKIKDI